MARSRASPFFFGTCKGNNATRPISAVECILHNGSYAVEGSWATTGIAWQRGRNPFAIIAGRAIVFRPSGYDEQLGAYC